MLGVLLVEEGSGSLGSVFVFFDIVRYRRVPLRGGDYSCSFLIPYSRVPINNQLEHNGYEWLAHFRFLVLRLSA